MSVESKEKKKQIIDRLEEALARCSVAILTDYRGLTTPEITTLRRRLQESGSEYKVVKNTLAQLAATQAGKTALVNAFAGPIAIALGYGDITVPAKVVADFISESKTSLSIKGGFTGDRLLTTAEVMSLATLPPREILIAQLLGQLNSPIATLLTYLTTPLSGMIGVLQARIKQLEGE